MRSTRMRTVAIHLLAYAVGAFAVFGLNLWWIGQGWPQVARETLLALAGAVVLDAVFAIARSRKNRVAA